MDSVSVGLASLALLLAYVCRQRDVLNAMPGPMRLPVLGTVQCQFRRLHLQFTEWAQQYGDVFRIQILSQPAIVINSYEAMKEAYVKKNRDFASRPHMLRFEVMGATKGIAFREACEMQHTMRVLAVKAVSLQGAGRHYLEGLITENLEDLVTLLEAHKGSSFNPRALIRKFLINVIVTMIFGEKCSYNDAILDGIAEFNELAVEAATIGREDVDVWTWTRHVNPNYTAAVRARAAFEKHISPLYKKYKDTYVEGHERGVIDSYIREVMNGKMQDENVLGSLIDYLVGGVETTLTTLYGFILILLHNPKIQQKIQSDIDDVIGQDRWPSLSDKGLLPYTQACILELFRYQSALPILVPRETINGTEICGYKIPKGTWVYTNSWAIHHDEVVYPEAMTFKPERFLDTEGQLLPEDHPCRSHIVTFGMGGRNCIGENLAKDRLFLSLCTLMQRFTFEEDKASPLPSADPRDYKLKIILDIADYKMKAIPRI